MLYLKQKFVWVGAVAALVILMIFGLAMMGSVLGAKPKALPMALVVEDRPAALPTGGQLAVGEMVKGKLIGLHQLPVKWIIVASEAKAAAGLDRQEFYGALVLPADLSAGVLSIQGGQAKPATVKMYVNEGMNAQGSSAVKSILQQVTTMVSTELSGQMLQQIGQQTQQIPIGVAGALLQPFEIQEVIAHPVGANQAGGNAPNMLTQIIWLGSMVLSVFLYLAKSHSTSRMVKSGSGRWAIAAVQMATGLLFAAGVSGFLVWMVSSWYGMQISDMSAVWLFLWLAGSAFFLLQSALFNWLGLPAVALLVLLLFFSMPVLAMAPEFMPQATHDWLYSWIPFRYVSSGLRNLLYFGGGDGVSESARVLWWLGGISLVVMLASVLRRDRSAAVVVSSAK